MQDDSLSEQLAELDAFAKKELSQARHDLSEVHILIRQTSTEVERLTQRNDKSVAKQREAEANFDSVSREDFRKILMAASESQMHLLMMQSQLEHLQSRQRFLDRYIEAIQRIVEVTDPTSPLASESGAMAAAPPLSYLPSETATREPSTGQQFIAMVVQAQEEDRSRVARRIHDGPAQALTNIVLRAEICERLMDIDPDKARKELAQLKDVVNGTLRDTRQFILDIRPMILDDLGLFPTLRRYVETFGENSKIDVELTVVGQERRLEPHLEVTIFRIVQEALRNVAQHASAKKARVTLDVEGERIDIVVEDDGVGLDVNEVLASAREHKGRSFGIASMLERAEMLGGGLNIESTAGHGTKLMVAIPLGSLAPGFLVLST